MGTGDGPGRLSQPLSSGPDSVHDLGEVLEGLGRHRPLVLCSWRRRRSEDFGHVAGGLGITPRVFEGVEEHVPRPVVEAAWRAVQEQQADAVVSFGGGSAIDLGKALVSLSLHGWEGFDGEPESEGRPPASRSGLAHIAVPTTYSGAAATRWFWVSEREEKRRRGGPQVVPDHVVLDPLLTTALPWKPTAATGAAGLALALEALGSLGGTGESEELAAGAAGAFLRDLPAAVRDPGNARGRTSLLQASFAAGLAANLAAPGLQQALGVGLGGKAGVPHGLANAILLSHVLRFNADATAEAFARAGPRFGLHSGQAVPEAVEIVLGGIGLPRTLREVGVFEQDLPPVAHWVASRSPEARTNPRPFVEEDVLAILRAAW